MGAYLLWGVFPLYLALLRRSPAPEIVVHRVLWSLLLCLTVTLLRGSGPALRAVLADRRMLGRLAVAAVVLATNWGTYVFAVTSGHVVEAALGYFVNPLVTVLLGVLVLHEHLRPAQWVAVATGGVAVVILTVGYGSPPVVALVLAVSFATYGLIKNRVGGSVDALTGLTVESLVLAPVALAGLLWFTWRGRGTLSADDPGYGLLLASTGIVTIIPLLLFASAARRVPLSVIGLLQYLTPAMQFLCGVLVFGEHMPPARWAGFALVWTALVVLTGDSLHATRRRRVAREAASTATGPGTPARRLSPCGARDVPPAALRGDVGTG